MNVHEQMCSWSNVFMNKCQNMFMNKCVHEQMCSWTNCRNMFMNKYVHEQMCSWTNCRDMFMNKCVHEQIAWIYSWTNCSWTNCSWTIVFMNKSSLNRTWTEHGPSFWSWTEHERFDHQTLPAAGIIVAAVGGCCCSLGHYGRSWSNYVHSGGWRCAAPSAVRVIVAAVEISVAATGQH